MCTSSALAPLSTGRRARLPSSRHQGTSRRTCRTVCSSLTQLPLSTCRMASCCSVSCRAPRRALVSGIPLGALSRPHVTQPRELLKHAVVARSKRSALPRRRPAPAVTRLAGCGAPTAVSVALGAGGQLSGCERTRPGQEPRDLEPGLSCATWPLPQPRRVSRRHPWKAHGRRLSLAGARRVLARARGDTSLMTAPRSVSAHLSGLSVHVRAVTDARNGTSFMRLFRSAQRRREQQAWAAADWHGAACTPPASTVAPCVRQRAPAEGTRHEAAQGQGTHMDLERAARLTASQAARRPPAGWPACSARRRRGRARRQQRTCTRPAS